MREDDYGHLLLPGLPVETIISAYLAAPGNEIASRKFENPEVLFRACRQHFWIVLCKAGRPAHANGRNRFWLAGRTADARSNCAFPLDRWTAPLPRSAD